MKKLVDKLNNRWLIGIIGVLVLSLVIWLGADYIKFGAGESAAVLSHATRWIIIAIIFVTWLTISLLRWGLEQRQNKELLSELEVDDKPSTDPDQERSSEELKLLAGRFKEALQVLKKSRFKSAKGSKTLYQLPWYMIIGPPGAGKTTALVNSGLSFPLADSHGSSALGGLGGTRHCDWWFTNDAVLIDTAGRYTTQDSHRVVDNNAWSGFLKLLKKYRPRRPINGVIVAISLQELMLQTAEQRQQHALTIRSRIDELQEQLGISFPVYLLFTKGDLVAGFSEFFANQSQAEREQVWGMTLPLGIDPAQIATAFADEYQQLIARLNQHLLARIDNERNIDARKLILGFPNRMDSLQSNLQSFIEATFAASSFKQAPALRGIYFTSATQQGSPIDRMMAAVSANFGLPDSVTAPQVGSGKSFFLKRLMSDVIFAEAELVGNNRKIEALLLWGRRLSFALLAVLGIGLTITWATTVSKNRAYMGDVNSAIADYQRANERLGPVAHKSGAGSIDALLELLHPLYTASTVYDQSKHPRLSGLGLYDESVDSAAQALYQQQLQNHFLPVFRTSLERELGTLRAEDPQLPDTLATYIMLSEPSRKVDADIHHWAESYWRQQYQGQGKKQQRLLNHLDTMLDEPLPASQAKPQVIKRARLQLSRIPMSQRLYKQLQQNNNEWVDLYPQIGGDSQLAFGIGPENPLFSSAVLYTKAGFEQADYSANSQLINRLDEDRWIYGDTEKLEYSSAEREELSEQIERAYLNDYARHWQKFLKSLNIAPFSSLSASIESLELLSDPNYSPLLTTLELATNNTTLRPSLPGVGSATGAVNKILPKSLKPTVVDRQFRELHRLIKADDKRPAAIAKALQVLGELKTFMDDIANSGNPGHTSYQLAKGRFNGTSSDPIHKLRRLASQSPEPLQHWLSQVADHSWATILAATSRHVSREWHQQVYASYSDHLAARYPLHAGAESETSLANFTDFFGPDGIESTFFNDFLKPFIDTRKWQLRRVNGRSLTISSQAMAQLQRARQLRQAYYPNNRAQLGFSLRLKPLKMDAGIKRFSLELGRSRLSYTHGPQLNKEASWRGGEDDRVRVLFEDLNGDTHPAQYHGDWAWLHLLDAAELQTAGNAIDATFSIGSRKSQYRLTANTSANPLNTQLLHGYRCPEQL